MKSVISSAMPSGAIAGKAASGPNAALNKSAARTGFTQPPTVKPQFGGNNGIAKPTAHSYKAADFTVSMNMDDANRLQAQDRNNFQAIGQRGYNNSYKAATMPKLDTTAPTVDVNQVESAAVNTMRLNEQYKINSSFMGAEQESLLNTT